jgi:hypothetical protein
MKCRKCRNDVRTGRKSLVRDKFREHLNGRLFGIRHEGGVILTQAYMWNVGTCYCDGKGETQEPKLKCESTDTHSRGGAGCSSEEVPVMGMEQRARVIWLEELRQLERGGPQ